MSMIIYGDPHGEWRPLLAAVEEEVPNAVVILGNCAPDRPIRVELAPLFAARIKVRFLYGDDDNGTEQHWDSLMGDPSWALLHTRIVRLGSFEVAGLAGVFKQGIWLPPDPPVFRSTYACFKRLAQHDRWRGGLPLKLRNAIFPDDLLPDRKVWAEILVAHEAPSSHRCGFGALDDLAHELGARLVVHGRHGESYIGKTSHGVTVIGLGRAEVLRLRDGDLP